LIKSFKHKGLEKFYLTGSKAGIIPSHARKLEERLRFLELASAPADLDQPGWFLHTLSGQLAGHWSVRVSGNWRVTFRFTTDGVEVVDYQDYH
jgi:proteic killer suppression protein